MPPTEGAESSSSTVDENGVKEVKSYTSLSLSNASLSGGLIITGLQLFFLPETSLSTIAFRAGITSLTNGIGHILVPAKLRDVDLTGISPDSVVIAFTTGAMISSGLTLLFFSHEKTNKFLKRCLGGTLLNFGCFLWAPSSVRYFWQFSMSYLTAEITTTALVKNSLKGLLFGWLWDIVSHYVGKGISAGMKSLRKEAIHDTEQVNNNSSNANNANAIIPLALQKPLGGGLFLVGLYLWVPPYFRGYFDIAGRMKVIFKAVLAILPFLSSSATTSTVSGDH